MRPIPFLGGTAIVNGLASIQVDEGVEGLPAPPTASNPLAAVEAAVVLGLQALSLYR